MAIEPKPSFTDLYKKTSMPMPVKEYIEFDQTYEDAMTEALGKLKGKKANNYKSALELLTDGVIAYRKAAKHPHASEKKEHRHMYVNELQEFLDAYAQQNRLGDDGLEKLLKTASGRKKLLQEFMEHDKDKTLDSDITYRLENLVPADDESLKGMGEEHLNQNPHLKKEYSKHRIHMLKTQRKSYINEMKGKYTHDLPALIRDYQANP